MASFPPGSSYSPQPQSRAHKIHTPQTTPPQPPRPWPQVSGSLPTWGSPEGDRSPVSPQDKARLLRCPQPHTTPPLAASLLSPLPPRAPNTGQQSPHGPRPNTTRPRGPLPVCSLCLEPSSRLVPQCLDLPVQKLPCAAPGWVRGSPLGSAAPTPALQPSYRSAHPPAPRQARSFALRLLLGG